jgi:hypothetical protein
MARRSSVSPAVADQQQQLPLLQLLPLKSVAENALPTREEGRKRGGDRRYRRRIGEPPM